LALPAALPVHPEDFAIVWRLVLCGIGFGLLQSPNKHATVTTTPMRQSGEASGICPVKFTPLIHTMQ